MTDVQDDAQDRLLAGFGYKPQLNRAMGRLASFAVSFSGISITAGIVLTLPFLLSTSGTAGMWTWPIGSVGVFLTALVFADLAGRIPVAGYAYQWGSRLFNPSVGWILAIGGLIAFLMGSTGGPVGIAPFWMDEFGITITRTSTVITAAIIVISLAIINIVGVRLASRINMAAVVAEIVSGVLVAVGLIITAAILHPQSAAVFFEKQPGASGSYLSAFVLAFLMGAFTLTCWELPADMAEETHNATTTAPRAMLQSVALSGILGMVLLAALIYAAPNVTSVVDNGVLSVITYQWGTTLERIVNVFILVAITASALMVQAGAARLVFSLARDRMVPGSRFFSRVAPSAKTPYGAIVGVAIFAITVFTVGSYVSSKVLGYLLSCTAVGFSLVYLAVSIAFLYKVRAGTLPERHGKFALGKWAQPVAWLSTIYMGFLVVVLTIPKINRPVGITTVVLIGICLLWYVVYLRGALRRGHAGPPVIDVIAPDVLAPQGVSDPK